MTELTIQGLALSNNQKIKLISVLMNSLVNKLEAFNQKVEEYEKEVFSEMV